MPRSSTLQYLLSMHVAGAATAVFCRKDGILSQGSQKMQWLTIDCEASVPNHTELASCAPQLTGSQQPDQALRYEESFQWCGLATPPDAQVLCAESLVLERSGTCAVVHVAEHAPEPCTENCRSKAAHAGEHLSAHQDSM